jgi:hypothetical protein
MITLLTKSDHFWVKKNDKMSSCFFLIGKSITEGGAVAMAMAMASGGFGGVRGGSTRGNTVATTRGRENYHKSSKRTSENPDFLLIVGPMTWDRGHVPPPWGRPSAAAPRARRRSRLCSRGVSDRGEGARVIVTIDSVAILAPSNYGQSLVSWI